MPGQFQFDGVMRQAVKKGQILQALMAAVGAGEAGPRIAHGQNPFDDFSVKLPENDGVLTHAQFLRLEKAIFNSSRLL